MPRLLSALFVFLAVSGPAAAADPVEPLTLMPRVGDYTLMYWADGFPSHTPTAPWRRVIRTGSYAFVLDTETLTIPHFRPHPVRPRLRHLRPIGGPHVGIAPARYLIPNRHGEWETLH